MFLPLDIFWFVYASLIRWRTSRAAFLVLLGMLQYYVVNHGVDTKAPSPLDVFVITHFMAMVFPGLAGLLVGAVCGYMKAEEVQPLYRYGLYLLLGGLSIYFANDIRYALWNRFL